MLAALAFLLSVAGQAPQGPDAIEKLLDHLVTAYKSYGLPFPPDDAPLIEVDHMPSQEQGALHCAYLLSPANGGKPARFLVGTTEVTKPLLVGKPVSLTSESAAYPFDFGHINALVFFEDEVMTMAVVEHHRHHDQFARALAKRLLNSPFHSKARSWGHDIPPNLDDRVGDLAYQHLQNALLEPSSDRAAILRGMTDVLTKDVSLATPYKKEDLTDLALTSDSRYHGTSKNEQLIDALCDARVPDLYYHDVEGTNLDAPIVALIARGFDAVPALLSHLTDRRFSRCAHLAMNMGSPSIYRVGDICGQLLFAYRCEDQANVVGTPWEPSNRARLHAWWAANQGEAEDEYCLKWLTHPVGESPSTELALMAYKRFPGVLTKARKRLLAAGLQAQADRLDSDVARFKLQERKAHVE
ncbi:hypothetical protein [Fimbriimonas ginsengisoli]|uniref:Uncharacterized protein n=1 Tax=Fimbriimonas ginsengisoli Gsoil 348 TaxID=661478 RepID=A0A068NUX4_FIMGI|nr:hypothetical protein [Fimbriimonas ginsengisoli]AIE85404.1 hypothetical protein OP10G_2036 [Fimbriimonas ginsengisoli Gsoil 348]